MTGRKWIKVSRRKQQGGHPFRVQKSSVHSPTAHKEHELQQPWDGNPCLVAPSELLSFLSTIYNKRFYRNKNMVTF